MKKRQCNPNIDAIEQQWREVMGKPMRGRKAGYLCAICRGADVSPLVLMQRIKDSAKGDPWTYLMGIVAKCRLDGQSLYEALCREGDAKYHDWEREVDRKYNRTEGSTENPNLTVAGDFVPLGEVLRRVRDGDTTETTDETVPNGNVPELFSGNVPEQEAVRRVPDRTQEVDPSPENPFGD